MLRSILALSALVFPFVHCDCQSYGVDYQNGGSYVIDSTSTANFTIESEFSDCVGEADIILIADNEESWECSDVATTPDYTIVRSSCPILEDEMFTGLWTVVILDNNGNDSSVAFQRSFNLTLEAPSSDTSVSTTLSTVISTSDGVVVTSTSEAANAVLAIITAAGTTTVTTSTIAAAVAVKTADPTAAQDILALASAVLNSII